VHHVGILYDQFMMHGQRNIKLRRERNWRKHLTYCRGEIWQWNYSQA